MPSALPLQQRDPPGQRPAPGWRVLEWVHRNLFSSVWNGLLTLLALYGLYLVLPPFLQWALLDASWSGKSRADCTGSGACWVFIRVRLDPFLYGFYPETEVWRVQTTFGLFLALAAPLFWRRFPGKRWLGAFLLLGYPWVGFGLLYGGAFGLPVVETSFWGGLSLTLVLAYVGMVAALPLGILLALGRRSELPLVRALSIAFIEFWRGVPLITVLFMSSVMLPLFLPEGVSFDKLLRALIGIVLFQSAYMAEVVRGGLQAIPRGQYEAAQALGLGYWRTLVFVILPQALKLVIPGIVNTFIALFKDTSLVLIIGLFDLLAVVQNAFADPLWLGYSLEGYVFAGTIFWLFCFAMSRYSQALERRLHTGH